MDYCEECCEVMENIHGDIAIIYYWDEECGNNDCRGWEIFEGGDKKMGRGFHPCANGDAAYLELSRRGFRY